MIFNKSHWNDFSFPLQNVYSRQQRNFLISILEGIDKYSIEWISNFDTLTCTSNEVFFWCLHLAWFEYQRENFMKVDKFLIKKFFEFSQSKSLIKWKLKKVKFNVDEEELWKVFFFASCQLQKQQNFLLVVWYNNTHTRCWLRLVSSIWRCRKWNSLLRKLLANAGFLLKKNQFEKIIFV